LFVVAYVPLRDDTRASHPSFWTKSQTASCLARIHGDSKEIDMSLKWFNPKIMVHNIMKLGVLFSSLSFFRWWANLKSNLGLKSVPLKI